MWGPQPEDELQEEPDVSLRVHQVFSWDGGFSNERVDPRASCYFVAASSVGEAYKRAYQETWAVGPDRPTGILEIHMRWGKHAGEHWVWCGCVLPGGMGVNHGDGLRVIRSAMRRHLEATHESAHHRP